MFILGFQGFAVEKPILAGDSLSVNMDAKTGQSLSVDTITDAFAKGQIKVCSPTQHWVDTSDTKQRPCSIHLYALPSILQIPSAAIDFVDARIYIDYVF